MRFVPEQIARWMPRRVMTLEPDGFGRSDTREALRCHFEIDAEHIAFATLVALTRDGQLDERVVFEAGAELRIKPEAPSPLDS